MESSYVRIPSLKKAHGSATASVSLLQLLSRCAAGLSREAIRPPAPLLSASLTLNRCPALRIDKSPLRDYKLVMTDGCVVTTAGDAIAGAFACEN